MKHGLIAGVFVLVGCAESSTFEGLPEQPPNVAEEGAGAPMPCTDDPLPSDPATRRTGVDAEDGHFFIWLSSQEDACEEVGWWAGWSVRIDFADGRPVVGTYDLDADPDIEARGSYAEGKTAGIPTSRPGGRLQVLDVHDDGSIEGALCGVVLDTFDDGMLPVDGRFTAGPC